MCSASSDKGIQIKLAEQQAETLPHLLFAHTANRMCDTPKLYHISRLTPAPTINSGKNQKSTVPGVKDSLPSLLGAKGAPWRPLRYQCDVSAGKKGCTQRNPCANRQNTHSPKTHYCVSAQRFCADCFSRCTTARRHCGNMSGASEGGSVWRICLISSIGCLHEILIMHILVFFFW